MTESSSAYNSKKIAALPLLRRIRYYFETAGFFLVIGFFRLFGLDRASAIGGWIGRNLVAPTSMSRRAIANLTAAYPEKSSAEISTIVRAMGQSRPRARRICPPRQDPLSGPPAHRALRQGVSRRRFDARQGHHLHLRHFANWEIMPFGAHDYGYTGGVVVRPANNPMSIAGWKARIRNGMPEQIPKGRFRHAPPVVAPAQK
jgi:KDO2-lipid IV(A) lauroyltransferase